MGVAMGTGSPKLSTIVGGARVVGGKIAFFKVGNSRLPIWRRTRKIGISRASATRPVTPGGAGSSPVRSASLFLHFLPILLELRITAASSIERQADAEQASPAQPSYLNTSSSGTANTRAILNAASSDGE
jgi:hypothetical protein